MRKIALLTIISIFFIYNSFSQSSHCIDAVVTTDAINGIPKSEDIGGVSFFLVDVDGGASGRKDIEAINYNPFMVTVVCSIKYHEDGSEQSVVISKIIGPGLYVTNFFTENGVRGVGGSHFAVESITRKIE